MSIKLMRVQRILEGVLLPMQQPLWLVYWNAKSWVRRGLAYNTDFKPSRYSLNGVCLLVITHIRTQRGHLNSKVTDIEPPGKI